MKHVAPQLRNAISCRYEGKFHCNAMPLVSQELEYLSPESALEAMRINPPSGISLR
jgi:hypothetical protein